MQNEQYKNWNNFSLGLVVVAVTLISIPTGLKTVLLVILGLLISLFSLARVGGARSRPAASPSVNPHEPPVVS